MIRASTDAPNAASIRLMGRLGMRLVERTPGARWERVFYTLDQPRTAAAPEP